MQSGRGINIKRGRKRKRAPRTARERGTELERWRDRGGRPKPAPAPLAPGSRIREAHGAPAFARGARDARGGGRRGGAIRVPRPRPPGARGLLGDSGIPEARQAAAARVQGRDAESFALRVPVALKLLVPGLGVRPLSLPFLISFALKCTPQHPLLPEGREETALGAGHPLSPHTCPRKARSRPRRRNAFPGAR